MNINTAHLYDSDTTELVTARDLGISRAAYLDAIRDSRDCEQAEGHIRVIGTKTGRDGRRVYAQ